MRTSHHVIALTALTLVATTYAGVTPITVVNPGFEDITGESPVNEFTFGPLNGWDLYEDPIGLTDGGNGPTFFIGTLTPFEDDPVGNPGVFVNFPDGAPVGNRVAIAFNFVGSDGIGTYGLQQTLADTLQPSTMYTLEVEVGNITTGTAMSGQTFFLEGFPGYRVELLAGGQVLECDDNTLAGSIPDGEFATSTVTFTTGTMHDQLDQPLGIRLINLNEIDAMFPGSDLEVDFDDVRLTAMPVSLPCPWDCAPAGGNSEVNIDDLLAVINAFGSMDTACDNAPENGDGTFGNGIVNIDDLLGVINNFGACP
ncbi:MAG: hypothetical protein AAF432_06295 [Planctomycetota bacterium]